MNARLRVLYVDDSRHDRELVRESLEREGPAFELVEAHNGHTFLSLLNDGHYDLVLSDFNILGFEGLQVLDAVRARSQRIPVVIVTGTGSEEVAAEALRRGAADYVIKTPHHIKRLPFTLRSAIHQARLREEHQRSLDALRESEQRLRLAMWASQQGLFELDVASETARITLEPTSPSGGIHRLTPMHFKQLRAMIYPPDQARVWREFRRHVVNEAPDLRVEFRVISKPRELRWIQASGMAVRVGKHGQVGRILGMFADITQQRERDEQLRLTASVFENTRESIIIVDTAQKIVSANQACCELLGYRVEELWSRTIRDLRSARHDETFLQLLDERLSEAGHWQGEMWAKRKDGSELPTLEVISQVLDNRGAITHYIHIATDISREKEADERLHRLAFYDPLTGLPNRAVFADRVERALFSNSRQQNEVVLMFIDLDRFKQVNDTLGHPVGDALLCEVARRLEEAVREMDTICRLGGDEFLILLPRGGDRAAVRVAEKLRELIGRPFSMDGSTLSVTCSIGISLAPRDGKDYSSLLATADTALYQAKAAGRNAYAFYSSEMNTAANARLQLEKELQHAMVSGELSLCFQPQIELRTSQAVGLEALIRWHHPRLGALLPDDFMPTARESGLAAQIDQWVLTETCRHLAAWRAQGLASLPISINLTARLFMEGTILAVIDAALEAFSVPPQLLVIELTERTLLDAPFPIAETLTAIRARGVTVALDNFGASDTSLCNLRHLPLDTLKIDGSLIAEMSQGPREQAVASAIITLARALGLQVVAEGVETAAQRDLLIEYACDRMQGFVHSHPMDAEEVGKLLAPPVSPGAKHPS